MRGSGHSSNSEDPEAGESVQGYPQLHIEFKANSGYLRAGRKLPAQFQLTPPYLASIKYSDFRDTVLSTNSCEQPRGIARAGTVWGSGAEDSSKGGTPHLALRFVFSNPLPLDQHCLAA